MPEPANKAIFLSYARDDAAAARRIAEALRSAGLEVWFDENELRGGDSWDAKIRRQINDCVLFVPLISQHTESREKGYFRLEWKLAVEQTHMLLEGVPFLVPVAIDDTPESAAAVPPEFMRVQWTRLPGALPSPQFIAQVKRLLVAPPLSAAGKKSGLPASVPMPVSAPAKSRLPSWAFAALGAAVLGLLAFLALRPSVPEAAPPAAPAKAAAETKPAATPPAAPKVDPKSIAVLPFANMSDDKDASAFFADGIHEEILTNLALIAELRVVSRTSVGQYRDTKKPMRQIGAELGVTWILEGSVFRAGTKVRVTAQLIRAATDEHAWAKSYTRDLADIFAIQAELAQTIAGSLEAAISPQEKARLARAPTSNTTAYDLYLKTLKALARGDDFDRALPLLESAVQLDPKFAQAWGELGRTCLEINKRHTDPTGALLEKAQRAIDTMERLAPDEPDTLLRLVRYYSRADNSSRSEIYLQRAAKALPGNGEVVQLLGDVEKRHHRFAEALAHYRKAYELDRQSPVIQEALAFWLRTVRRYDEAETIVRAAGLSDAAAVLALYARGSTRETEQWLAAHSGDQPGFNHMSLAWQAGLAAEFIRLGDERKRREGPAAISNNEQTQTILARMALGDTARAKEEAAKYLATHPGASGRLQALNLAVLGDKHAALESMDRYLADAKQRGVDLDLTNFPSGYASVLAWVDEKDQAVAELARLLKLPASGVNVHTLRRYPVWKPLQGYPPFEALLNDPKNNAPLF